MEDQYFSSDVSTWKKLIFTNDAAREIIEKALKMESEVRKQVFDDSVWLHVHTFYIFESNRCEGAGENEQATREIIAMLNSSNNIPACAETFMSETNNENHHMRRREVVQHFLAYIWIRKASIEDIWTVAGIQNLHAILTHRLEHADKATSVSPGIFRNAARYATGVRGRSVEYLEHAKIPQQMERFVTCIRDKLIESVAQGPSAQMFLIVGWILYKFLLIHPFGDGNGRLARLLANHVFVCHGIHVPVTFVAGIHRKSKHHYMDALDRGQHRGDVPTILATFAAEMMSQSFQMF